MERPPTQKNEGRRLLTGPGVVSSDALEPIENASETYTLEQGINAAGVGRFQNWLMLYVGFAWMSDAMEMMLLSFLGPEVGVSAIAAGFGALECLPLSWESLGLVLRIGVKIHTWRVLGIGWSPLLLDIDLVICKYEEH